MEPNRVRGVGYDYTFRDQAHQLNLALNRPANQSSTAYGGEASRAVDGVTNGHYASLSVTHTAGHGGNDPEPWWQVDLSPGGGDVEIGSVRLWNRIQEPNVDEVQTITADASEKMSGTFTIGFNFSGTYRVTSPIRHDAPARITDEAAAGDSYAGESMQAKLQELDNIGSVQVDRKVFDALNGGHIWTVTFLSEPGNLMKLEVVDTSKLTAQGSRVLIHTLRHGNANVWYNYKYGLASIRGRLFPSWVMVLPDIPTNFSSLEAARASAVYSVRLTEEKRETILTLPRGPTFRGRYVRVQLEGDEYLSLAELQVFASRDKTIRYYTGGSPIVAGTYQPEESLRENFRGLRSRGPWILSLSDLAPRVTVQSADGRPSHDAHGRGAIDDWVLVLNSTSGRSYKYHMDVSAVVKNLPVYGKLYVYDEVNKARGMPIRFVKGLQRTDGACLGSCADRNYGRGTDLAQGIAGSAAAQNIVIKDRLIVYAPARDYVGEDTFSYTIFQGTRESPNHGAVTMDVRKCRQSDCLTEAFGDTNLNLQELWYRKEGQPLSPIKVPHKYWLDQSNLLQDPWRHTEFLETQFLGAPPNT